MSHFWTALKSPLAILFHVVALAFALFHTCTWFNLTPKALVVRRERKSFRRRRSLLPTIWRGLLFLFSFAGLC